MTVPIAIIPHPQFLTCTSEALTLNHIQALLLFARCLDSERLRRDGQAQWQRWFVHISTYGIDEFCSSTYNEVVYEGLLGIRAAATDTRMRAEVTRVLDHVSALQHAVSHPVLRLDVVGSSRDYRRFLKPGGGAFRYLDHAGDAAYRPPAEALREFRHRDYPHFVDREVELLVSRADAHDGASHDRPQLGQSFV